MNRFQIVFIFCLFMMFSCRKPENVPAPSSVISGKRWKLISYSFNGTDITNKFSNCILTFEGNGTLKIVNAGQNYSGSWVEYSAPPKLELNIFTSDPVVSLFNRTWENKLLNPTRIELADLKIQPQEIVKLDLIP
ncbi:MAG: hypothetical protein ACK55K_00275 [Bacteroidota bacterium]